MLTVNIGKIRKGQEPRLRAWMAEMSDRKAEVLETFRAQGVRSSQAFIVHGEQGSLFVLVAEIEDRLRARTAFDSSEAPIDLEFKHVVAECLEGHIDDDPVWECRLSDSAAG